MQAIIEPGAILKVLGDPTRRAVFEALAQKKATVTQLTRSFSVSQPAISQHLKALREAGLVEVRRQGREAHYEAKSHGLAPLIDWIKHYEDFWTAKDGGLRAVLKEIE